MDIDEILYNARNRGCSDVHLTVGMPPVVRDNGVLKCLPEYPELSEKNILSICDRMTSDKQKSQVLKQIDTDFTFVSESGHRHRVNIYRQRGNTAVAIRILHADIPTLSDLKLPPVLSDFSAKPRGLVLVTGPTGSGKSTTLAAMIDQINTTKSSHIITIEDPIEYMHTNKKCMINQREVGLDVPDFASALRSALREDPDVILVGEMRDLETVNAAVTAAETGHLVLSTLHTSGAASTIDRIIDVFPGHQQKQIRTQLASVLVGICTQTLIPRADGNGRIACLEILSVTDAVSSMIREDKVHLISSAIQTGKAQGMQSLDQELARMVRENVISLQSGIERCSSPAEFNRFLNNAR